MPRKKDKKERTKKKGIGVEGETFHPKSRQVMRVCGKKHRTGNIKKKKRKKKEADPDPATLDQLIASYHPHGLYDVPILKPPSPSNRGNNNNYI